MNISMRTRTNSLFSSSYASEERIQHERQANNEIFLVQEKIMSSSSSSDQEDSLSRAKEVIAQARSQRHTSSSPRNSKRRRNTSYDTHAVTTSLTRQQRKEKETAMLLEEIMLVKQKILIKMKNTKTPNADRDSCIQSFLQACDAFSRVQELNSTKNKERSTCSSARREERKTVVKFDLSKNEVFLF
ncbi:predicted protein [Chaetoceros tenuissimus]|uniref:Uncharacterized protein n=1 Tax=Chaetoceros tenuissimus TaxID=426638 RepID=A0AAD3H703_9STRA|nr:predicted protein [Chaetoceros tenuissimus]